MLIARDIIADNLEIVITSKNILGWIPIEQQWFSGVV